MTNQFISANDAVDMLTSGERRIFAASHGWHGGDKGPDPTGARLKQSIAFLRWLLGHLPEHEFKRYGYFIDWMCLWQGQRTPEQQAQFGEALRLSRIVDNERFDVGIRIVVRGCERDAQEGGPTTAREDEQRDERWVL